MLNFVKYSIYPIVIIASCYGLWALLQTQLPVGIVLLIVSAANIITVAIVELMLPYKKTWGWLGHRQTLNDILHGIATSELGPRIASLAFGGVVITLAAAVADTHGGGWWPHGWHFVGQLALAIVIADFTEWGKHWMHHNVSFLWPIHALHHDVDRQNVTKGMRLHFIEGAVRYVGITSVLTILGAPVEILIWYTALLTFNGSLNHSNIDLHLPPFMNVCFQTTHVHRLHHSRNRDLGCSNLASITTLPDHLFGTFRNPAHYQHGELGIENNPIPKNWFLQLLAPFNWQSLVRKTGRGENNKEALNTSIMANRDA